MDSENKYYDLVYSYFEGELDENEKNKFLKEVETNDELKEAFEKQKAINKLLRNDKLINFQEQLEEAEKEIERSEDFKKRLRRFIYPAAAILVVLVTTVFISKYYKKQYTTREIFAEYYEFNPSGELIRGDDDNASELKTGLIEYDKHNYKQTISILESLLEKEPENVKARLYLSLAHMETNNFEDAIMNLEKIKDNSNHILIDQIKWNLALCYLMKDNKKEAINAFSELSESEYKCKDKSKEILIKLDSTK